LRAGIVDSRWSGVDESVVYYAVRYLDLEPPLRAALARMPVARGVTRWTVAVHPRG
jgi:hypothetical protein